jgi:hypothetical protein
MQMPAQQDKSSRSKAKYQTWAGSNFLKKNAKGEEGEDLCWKAPPKRYELMLAPNPAEGEPSKQS